MPPNAKTKNLSRRSRRLGIIRGFARYRVGADPRTENPPLGLLRFRSQRARPYLYSEDEIRRLLESALKMKTHYELQRYTYYCLFGLLAVTGLRLGEAIRLQPQDVDLSTGILTFTVRNLGSRVWFRYTRPRWAVLRDYVKRRDTVPRWTPHAVRFFIPARAKSCDSSALSKIFRVFSRQIGIRKPGVRNGPRLHDFRHRFAIETLFVGIETVNKSTRLMPVLSTYLGHVNVSGTYWYLGSTPELIAAASKLIETRWKGVA